MEDNAVSRLIKDKVSSMLKEALALTEEGKPELAVAKLTRAIVVDPDNPDLFRHRAEACILIPDYHTAIINFEKVIALNPNEKEAISARLGAVYYQHGLALAANKEHEEAVEAFKEAYARDQDNKDLIMKRMECLIALQRYSECLAMIEKEMANDASNPDLLVIQAQLHLLFGQTSLGYYGVTRALELNPSHAEALEMKDDLEKKAQEYKNQAVHQSLLGKKREALNKISAAIDTDPTVAQYHILRGALYRRAGDFNAAVDDYLLAMDKCGHQQDSPVYIDASKQLVLTYNDFAMECFKRRHFESAALLLNKAIKEEKKEKGLYLNRGDCFYRLHDLRFALSDYQQALELDPSNWEVYCRVAIVCGEIGVELFDKERHTEAEEFFTSAIQHNPKVSWFYVCRARTRYELKNIKGTKEDIMRALVLNPDSDECVALVARVFPGKTKEVLLFSREAEMAREKLQECIAKLASRIRKPKNQASTTPALGAKPFPIMLDRLKLRVEDEGAETTETAGASSSGQGTAEPVCSLVESKSSNVVGSASGSAGRLSIEEREEEEEEEEGERVKAFSPREWSVLSRPLPKLADGGVQPTLKECQQENHFYKCIYYSKKRCTKELERVLKSPSNDYLSSKLPRVHNT